MDELFKLLRSIVAPGNNWGSFSRKDLSTLMVACIGAYAVNRYEHFNRSHWEDLPLHTAITVGDRRDASQKYLDNLMRSHQGQLKGIWVYSWPDARTLIPVLHSGHYENPMPIGYFQVKDANSVGQLVMEQCAEIERLGNRLTACPIMAENDAWGVAVFELKENKQDHWRSVYAALTHKLSHIIYHDHD